ncbi:hypothetical protein BDR07DRAFT_1237421, partial [Suillus spraguei]
LKMPFRVTTADGTLIKGGPITHYCLLVVRMSGKLMRKFNITKLGCCDQILLGIPWLHAMNPLINW